VIASRAGIINIGPEGQLIFGAMIGTLVALNVGGPGFLVVVLAVLGAAIGGAVWAGIAALLRFSRGVDVVISTLLLNFVAFEAVSYASNQTWLLQEARETNRQSLPQSERLPDDTRLPRLGEFPDFNVSTGIFIALVLTVVVALMLARSRWGFRLRMLGLNPQAARRAGVSVGLFGGGALLLSGAFAGVAGGVMLTGTVFRFQPGFSQNVGYEGLLAALIARRNALWTVPVAFFFGALRAGGGFLASTGVPRFLVDIVTALLVFATLFPPLFLEARERRRQRALARAAAQGDARPDDLALAVAS
jgi:simple sugar transport system permease protein